MKDKQAKKVTMNDLVNEYASIEKPVVEKQAELEIEETVKEEFTSEDYLQKLKDYNLQFKQDAIFATEEYFNVKPLHNVLVRIAVREPEVTSSGLLKPYKQIVPVPTQNGMANWAEIESPYPYDTLARVIAKPENISQVSVGDWVILSKNPVEAKVVGRSNEAYLSIPNSFTHPTWKEETPPKDPTNPHYGYLLVPVYEIKAIL